jgi:uncharacterized protein YfdQ (DUF2303 family)
MTAMTAETFKLLQSTIIDADDSRADVLSPLSVMALPDDYQLRDLEPFNEGRRRFRGVMQTQSLADFTDYAKRRIAEDGAATPAIFIDSENMRARAFFNIGTTMAPGHCDDSADLSLKATAALCAMRDVVRDRMSQKTLAEWLEDWGAHVMPVQAEGEEYITLAQAIAAIRRITVSAQTASESTVSNFRSSSAKLDSVDVTSRDRLPVAFDFVCVPFPGLPSRIFRLRLSVITGNDKPALALKVIRREEHDEAMAQDFKAAIAAELNTHSVALTVGTFMPDGPLNNGRR